MEGSASWILGVKNWLTYGHSQSEISLHTVVKYTGATMSILTEGTGQLKTHRETEGVRCCGSALLV